MIIDLTKPIESSQDPGLLTALLSALVGQPCLKAGLSYGGELMIHFGEPVPYTHPKLAGESKGAWILGVRASGWRLLLAAPPVLIEASWPGELRHWPAPPPPALEQAQRQPVREEEIEQTVRPLAGEFVAFARPFPLVLGPSGGVALELGFGNGANLVVCPHPEADEGDEPLADWELFTPYHTYLRCGPGLVWSFLRSDKVEGGRQQEGVA